MNIVGGNLATKLGQYWSLVELATEHGVTEDNLEFLRSATGRPTMEYLTYYVRNEMYRDEASAAGILDTSKVISLRQVARLWSFSPQEWSIVLAQRLHGLYIPREVLLKCALANQNGEANWQLMFLPGQMIGEQVKRFDVGRTRECLGVQDVMGPWNIFRSGESDFSPSVERPLWFGRYDMIEPKSLQGSNYALINFVPCKDQPDVGSRTTVKKVTRHRMVEAMVTCRLAQQGDGMRPYDFCLCEDRDATVVLRSKPSREKNYTVYFESDLAKARADFESVKKIYHDSSFNPCWEIEIVKQQGNQ